MSENQDNQEKGQTNSEPWNEVGRQFQTLGESIAQAFRSAWQDEGNRAKAEEMKIGLVSLVSEIGKAIEESASSEKGKKVIHEAEKAAQELHQAGAAAVQDMQPHLLSALRRVNQDLQAMIDRMDNTGSK
jgi:hypothetical protein